jgi:hypothetical protein
MEHDPFAKGGGIFKPVPKAVLKALSLFNTLFIQTLRSCSFIGDPPCFAKGISA